MKVLDINNYQRKDNKLRTKADVITYKDMMNSDNEKLKMFGRRMYNQQTKLDYSNIKEM